MSESLEDDTERREKAGITDSIGEILSKDQLKNLEFALSAITIHSRIGKLYMIAQTGKWLMTTDYEFNPKKIYFFDIEVFP